MRIPSVGPEISVLLDGAQVATSPSPSYIGTGVRPHRGDVDVNRKRLGLISRDSP